MRATYKLCVLPGDGIGPEVVSAALAVLAAVAGRFGFAVETEEALVGGVAIDATGRPLADETLRLARAADAVLLGAVGGPKWDDPRARVRPEQALLGLRKELDLFANLRPIRVSPALREASPLRAELLDGVDFLIVRELTGGIYFGEPSGPRQIGGIPGAVDTCCYTAAEVRRLLRVAFELATRRRRKLTSVDKANILATSRLWREVAREVAASFPDVAYEEVLVDAMAMHLVRRPRDFDVIATENMFGDILTDEAATLAGSLGLLPSASLGSGRGATGRSFGLYEPVHGSAPDIAGQDRANPLGAILSVALCLRHSLGEEGAAAEIEAAVDGVLANGARTPDVGAGARSIVGCREMGRLVAELVRTGGEGPKPVGKTP